MFEHLRNSDNATLAVPQLLDKAAGFFMGWLDGRRGRADAPARGGARAGKLDGSRHAGIRPVSPRRLPGHGDAPSDRYLRSL